MSDSRDKRIRKSHELRNLGRYSDALIHLRELAAEREDLNVFLEISRLLHSMGLKVQALETITAALDRFMHSENDVLLVAHARLNRSIITIRETVRASEELKVATEIYDKHLNGTAIPKYTQRMVYMEFVFSSLSEMLESLGHPTHNFPKTSIQKVKGLFRHCVEREWFDEAILMAMVYSDYYVSEREYRDLVSPDARKASLYQDLLGEPSVPEHVRAKSLIKWADILEQSGSIERAQEKITAAETIYRNQKHASGILLIEMDRLASPMPLLSPLQRVTKLEAIKKQLEEIGDWTYASEALKTMYRILMMEISDPKRAEDIYRETLTIQGASPRSLPLISWQLRVFWIWLRWAGAKPGMYLTSAVSLYNLLEDSEAPLLQEKIAVVLGDTYQYLGDEAKATKWRSRAQRLDRYSMLLPEPFSQRLRAMTTIPDFEEELADLARATRELACRASEDAHWSERDISVIRMCNIADIYMDQWQLREIDTTQRLVHYCLEQAEPLLPNITLNGRQKCTGHILQSRARMLSIKSDHAPPGYGTHLTMLEDALAAYEEVLHYYQNIKFSVQTGFASLQVAMRHQRLWEAMGNTPDSPSFHEAARLYEEGNDLLRRHGIKVDAIKINTQLCAELWFDHYRIMRSMPAGTWETSTTGPETRIDISAQSSFQRTQGYLEQLERMIDRQRHDLSFLAPEQALAAKQTLRNDGSIQKLYNIAFPLYVLNGDADRFWSTIQKSKARSVSDLLGLGVIVPKGLAIEIESDSEAKTLLQEEQRLLGCAQNESTDSQFQLRTTLDAHRERMRENRTLAELLELREGNPTTVGRLRAVAEVLKDQGSERRIIFADYLDLNGNLCLVVVLPDGLKFIGLGVSVEVVDAWRTKYLRVYEPLNEDNDDNLAALQELAALVQPFGQISNEGDLLILCASGPLHAVPLHALPLSKDSEISLIDRNPIVYCPNMTVFEQCVTRAHIASQRIVNGDQALLAVYETPNGFGWEDRRAEAYKAFSELTKDIKSARILTGAEVNAEQFKRECESAKVVHFLGHCNGGTQNSMQHLKLVASNLSTDTQPPPDNPTEENSPTQLPIIPFTISDLFSTSINASHFNLIACGSASQIVGQGDEPWGIVTALLCAGATSVGGAMWPIQVETGEMFMRMLYNDNVQIVGEKGIVDVAVAHQIAVKRLKNNIALRAPYHWAAFVLHGAWFYSSCQPVETRATDPVVDNGTSQQSNFQSIASSDENIASTAGSDFDLFLLREAATYLLVKSFINDKELSDLYTYAVQKLNKGRFVENNRRLLKSYYLNLKDICTTSLHQQCVKYLRSRNERKQISSKIYNSLTSSHTDVDEETETVKLELGQEEGTLSKIDRFSHGLKAEDFLANAAVQAELNKSDDNEISESDDSEEAHLESNGEDEMKNDSAIHANLQSAIDFLISGQPYIKYKKDLRHFLHKSGIIREQPLKQLYAISGNEKEQSIALYATSPENKGLKTKASSIDVSELPDITTSPAQGTVIATQIVAGRQSASNLLLASSTFSELSKSSVSSYTLDIVNDVQAAALDEVVAIFMSDQDLTHLFAEVFRKYGREKVLRSGVRLLTLLGRRFMTAAKTSAEKEGAGLLISRERNREIIEKLAQELKFRSSEDSTLQQEEAEEVIRKQQVLKKERLALYLYGQSGNPPRSHESNIPVKIATPSKVSKLIDDGSRASSDTEDEVRVKEQLGQMKIDVLRLVLKSSDAFARFKEELEDFVEPFQNEVMWRKTLWTRNGRQRVRFELSSTIPPMSRVNQLKLAAQERLGKPILWWPFALPREHLPPSKIRIIWICDCGGETYVDSSSAQAQRYRQTCQTVPPSTMAGQSPILSSLASTSNPILPTQNAASSTSGGSHMFVALASALLQKITNILRPRRAGNRHTPSVTLGLQQSASIVNTTQASKYIHWCVDSAPSRTFLHHVCIERKKGKEFINDLYKSYKRLRGWRWYLSMTTCAEIRLVRLNRVYGGEEAVNCFYNRVLPDLSVVPNEYTYDKDPDLEEEVYIKKAERVLLDYYHGYRCCLKNDIDQFILGIPHRVCGSNFEKKGFGIWARQGWTLIRLVAFGLITQSGALLFMIYWLCNHPGDLQNAFSPAYYTLGLVTIFVVIPDIFFT